MAETRVVIADRSPAVRAVLRRYLESADGVTVVGEGEGGIETVDLARRFEPDVLVLDLDLSDLAGRPLLDALRRIRLRPVFVVTPSRNRELTRTAFSAHGCGVVAVLPKPESPEEWDELGLSLAEAVGHCGAAAVGEATIGEPDETPVVSRRLEFLGVGASTGGPGAVFELLKALGSSSALGVFLVQHIARGFEETFAEWLGGELGLDVRVAEDGARLQPGQVLVAPPDAHSLLEPGGIVRLDTASPPLVGHRPAVNVLFRSLLAHQPDRVAAVLLSGMGTDGVDSMCDLRSANVLTIAQEVGTCAVSGMPRAAIQRGAASFALAPEEIGRLLVRANVGRQ